MSGQRPRWRPPVSTRHAIRGCIRCWGGLIIPETFNAAPATTGSWCPTPNRRVELITGDSVNGVESENVAFGVRNCWG